MCCTYGCIVVLIQLIYVWYEGRGGREREQEREREGKGEIADEISV